eukprot:TRINITY_DN32509_c0_g1_i1.p1 TRINITY_DN32509_c0_g1~~TRINITY_DN32509_c0_g1_i1.p1  ORF type:complete len:358 (-),score=80.31 TRINITY_DN32509_c0_g1_i1:218-1291(-)
MDALLDMEVSVAAQRRLEMVQGHGAMTPEDDCSASEGEDEEQMVALMELNRRHAHDLSPVQLQERENRQDDVRRAVKQAKSMEEVLTIAGTYVEPAWLFAVEEIHGDLYRVAAFGGISCGLVPFDLHAATRFWGCVCIWVIQVVGPFAIVWENRAAIGGFGEISATRSIDPSAKGFMHWSWHAWESIGLAKFMGVMFLFCYLLQALFSTSSEVEGWNGVVGLMNKLGEKRGKSKAVLYLGAFTHCWATLWSCVAAYIIIGKAENVKDVVFDAFGLTFLVQLDDIAGGMTFIEKVAWPSKGLGWLAKNLQGAEDLQDGSRTIGFAFRVLRAFLFVAAWIAPLTLAYITFTEEDKSTAS